MSRRRPSGRRTSQGAHVYGSDREIGAMSRRLSRLEHKLDLVLEHLGIEDDLPDDLAEVRELIHANKLIAAIKAYRQVTGASLKEAKDAVEQMAVRR